MPWPSLADGLRPRFGGKQDTGPELTPVTHRTGCKEDNLQAAQQSRKRRSLGSP